MSFTEQEAKGKWCPMAKEVTQWDTATKATFIPANRLAGGLPSYGCLCLASGCAVWVWNTNEWDHNTFTPDPSGELDEEGERKGTVEKHPEKRRGHCGLVQSR